MRVLVFSDIHGSLPAARLIQELVGKHRPESVILLGDILYHGPRNPLPKGYDPAATAAILGALPSRVIAVAGNCDSEVDKAVLPFPIAPEFVWVVTEGPHIFATHGHIHSPDKLPPLSEGDVFLYGHTHVPQARMQGGIALCNPGSLSLPKEDHPAGYGLFEFGAFTVVTTEGEVYLRLECL